jgi:hypothetical protein
MPVRGEMTSSFAYNRPKKRPSITPNFIKTRSKKILIDIPR